MYCTVTARPENRRHFQSAATIISAPCLYGRLIGGQSKVFFRNIQTPQRYQYVKMIIGKTTNRTAHLSLITILSVQFS